MKVMNLLRAYMFRIFSDIYSRLAFIIFFSISFPIMVIGRGEKSAYSILGNTFPSRNPFGLFGYNYILEDWPIMAENIYWIDQILMYSGSSAHLSYYFTAVRAFYGFLGSLFSPFLGVIGSMWLLNYIGWAVCVYTAWRITLSLSENRLAALFASIFVACGLGFVIHSNDYSPHLVPFMMYYVGLALIYQSNVWRSPQPLNTHLFLGVYLAIACLCYNNGMFLVIGYVLVSFRHNRWLKIVYACMIAVSAQYIWILFLNFIKMRSTGVWVWINISEYEQELLKKSLLIWYDKSTSTSEILKLLFDGLLQFSFFELPVIIILGIASWYVIKWSKEQRFFFLVFFSIPIAASMLYLNTSTTRGYLIYGISLLIYAPLAVWFAKIWSGYFSMWRWILRAAILSLLVLQFVWSTAFFWGYLFPITVFFGFGYTSWIPTYFAMFKMSSAYNLTGNESVPAFFGGFDNLFNAGIVVSPDPLNIKYDFFFSLLVRSILVIYIVFLFVLKFRGKTYFKFGLIALLLSGWIVPAILPQIIPPKAPQVYSTFYSIWLKKNQNARYTVNLSAQFIENISKYDNSNIEMYFMFNGLHPPYTTTISANNVVLGQSNDGSPLIKANKPIKEIVDILTVSPTIVVNMSPNSNTKSDGTGIYGWQKNGLVGREFTIDGAKWQGSSIPAFEIRLLDKYTGKLLVTGF